MNEDDASACWISPAPSSAAAVLGPDLDATAAANDDDDDADASSLRAGARRALPPRRSSPSAAFPPRRRLPSFSLAARSFFSSEKTAAALCRSRSRASADSSASWAFLRNSARLASRRCFALLLLPCSTPASPPVGGVAPWCPARPGLGRGSARGFFGDSDSDSDSDSDDEEDEEDDDDDEEDDDDDDFFFDETSGVLRSFFMERDRGGRG